MPDTGFVGLKPINFFCRPTCGVSACRKIRKTAVRHHIVAVVQREPDPLTESPLGPPIVLCFGDAFFDLLSSTPTAEISDRSQWSPTPGGATANVAVGLARLDTASAFIGNVGDDQIGDKLISVLKGYRVNTDGLVKVPGRATREVFVRRDETCEREFIGFGGANDKLADTCALDPDSLPGVLFYAAQVLVTPTLSLAFPESARSLQEIVDMAKICKLRVVVDVNWRPVFWDGMASEQEARRTILNFLKKADIVKISTNEVEFLYGPDLARVALQRPSEVLNQLGGSVKGVIVTAGSEGAAFVFDMGIQPSTGRIAAREPKRGVVDATGAGDAFLAGFLSEMLRTGGLTALADSEKVKKMALFAADVASFVVSAPGAMTSLPTRHMVESAQPNQTT